MSAINNVNITGRLAADPQIRENAGENGTTVARFDLAVTRRHDRNGKPDYIPCVAFGKTAEFVKQYYQKGTKIQVQGHLQTSTYEKDGTKFKTMNVVIEDSTFAESKKKDETVTGSNDFVDIPDGDEELPFN